jgi:hypothetical protein
MGNHFGFWWIIFLVGLGTGVLMRGPLMLFGATFLASVGGWGLDLLWQSLHVDIGGVASLLAGILGLGTTSGYLVIIITLLFAWLLCLSGMWVGAALRRLITITRPAQLGQAAPSQTASVNANDQATK